METFLEILKYILPSLIVFGATYFVLSKYLDNDYRKQLLMLRRENQKDTTPLRLQAFERLILFLERMSMDKLVLRVHKPGMSAKLLQAELVRAINEEFNHNLTQQVYIASSSWAAVKKAKDESLKVITIAGSQMDSVATGANLGQKIFEIMSTLNASPTQIAIDTLKVEIRQIF